jgi:hypothetical protein
MTNRSIGRPVGALTLVWALSVTSLGSSAEAQGPRTHTMPHLGGVYQAVPNRTVLPGGLRSAGGPAEIPLSAAGVEQAKQTDLAQDPEKQCQPIGPFRMMARDRLKFELVPAAAAGIIVMLFEDISHGHMRTIHLNGKPPDDIDPTWHGTSVGRWTAGSFIVETTGFNERTWLNESGARPSEALRLIERWRPVSGGRYLEYVAHIDDPDVLTAPYEYTRYFERVHGELAEDICEE